MYRWRMKLIATLAVTALLAGCAGAPLSKRDTALEIAFQTLNAADARTTARIEDHPHLVEGSALTRSVIGERPSSADSFKYFAVVGVSHWLIMRALPERWRPWFGGISIAHTADGVRKNCGNDLC